MMSNLFSKLFKTKKDIVINIIVIYFILNILYSFKKVFSILFKPSDFIISLPILSLILMIVIAYFLFKRNKFGWYLAVINSILIVLSTVISIPAYKSYLGAQGIFTLNELLSHSSLIFNFLYFIFKGIGLNVIIIFFLLKDYVRAEFSING